MTKREREQVVELLRCAADIDNVITAAAWLDCPDHRALAYRLLERTWEVLPYFTYSEALLEAAARVEEGSWP